MRLPMHFLSCNTCNKTGVRHDERGNKEVWMRSEVLLEPLDSVFERSFLTRLHLRVALCGTKWISYPAGEESKNNAQCHHGTKQNTPSAFKI